MGHNETCTNSILRRQELTQNRGDFTLQAAPFFGWVRNQFSCRHKLIVESALLQLAYSAESGSHVLVRGNVGRGALLALFMHIRLCILISNIDQVFNSIIGNDFNSVLRCVSRLPLMRCTANVLSSTNDNMKAVLEIGFWI